MSKTNLQALVVLCLLQSLLEKKKKKQQNHNLMLMGFCTFKTQCKNVKGFYTKSCVQEINS